jgi:hypothetical protein
VTWTRAPVVQAHHSIKEIKRWLGVFLLRFFKEMQYKRTCLPNGPKVGAGGSLSLRSDYHAPSDADATVWLAEPELVPGNGAAPLRPITVDFQRSSGAGRSRHVTAPSAQVIPYEDVAKYQHLAMHRMIA